MAWWDSHVRKMSGWRMDCVYVQEELRRGRRGGRPRLMELRSPTRSIPVIQVRDSVGTSRVRLQWEKIDERGNSTGHGNWLDMGLISNGPKQRSRPGWMRGQSQRRSTEGGVGLQNDLVSELWLQCHSKSGLWVFLFQCHVLRRRAQGRSARHGGLPFPLRPASLLPPGGRKGGQTIAMKKRIPEWDSHL